MLKKSRMVWVSLAVLLVVVIVGTGSVIAKSVLNPVDNGVINGAYHKETGMLRLVNSDEDVRPSEEFIYWNQVGEKGEKGDPGEPGPAGPPGEPGGIDEATAQEIKDVICLMCEALDMNADDVPGFCFAIKQRGTIQIMANILTANEDYYLEHNQYASSMETLAEWFLPMDLPIEDAWGNPFFYDRYDPGTYMIKSLGYDNDEGPTPPDPWYYGESGESDIIYDFVLKWLQVPVEP
jgi:hypothetical protein